MNEPTCWVVMHSPRWMVLVEIGWITAHTEYRDGECWAYMMKVK